MHWRKASDFLVIKEVFFSMFFFECSCKIVSAKVLTDIVPRDLKYCRLSL
jgi:hypothetical protein